MTTTAWVQRLHEAVDELARPIAEFHGARLRCHEGCSDCCTDGLTVFSIEAALIRAKHAELLEQGRPHPEGACAFLDERGACRIYAERPYVCRTQGLPLRWVDVLDEEADAPELVETRDVCPKSEEGPALEELPAEVFFTLGPVEERLLVRQTEVDGGRAERVALRSLFASGSDGRVRLPIVR